MQDDRKATLLTIEALEAQLKECKRLLSQIDAVLLKSLQESSELNRPKTDSRDSSEPENSHS